MVEGRFKLRGGGEKLVCATDFLDLFRILEPYEGLIINLVAKRIKSAEEKIPKQPLKQRVSS